jgi:hypothetical protein
MTDSKLSPVSRRTRVAPILCLGLLLAAAGPASASPGFTVVEGRVEMSNLDPPSWQPARVGDPVRPGDAIRTGRASRAELDLGDAKVRLYENTVLRLPADAFVNESSRAVELREGHSLFDIMKKKSGGSFEVRTPEAVALVKGTRFAVGIIAEHVTVSVFEGLVGVRSALQDLEREILVRPGFSAIGGIDDSFELLLERIPDPWESWSGGLPLELPTSKHPVKPPAKIAVDEARDLARKSVSGDVLKHAARRNPQLRERLERRAVEARAVQAAALKAAQDADGSTREPGEIVKDAPSWQPPEESLPDPITNEGSAEAVEQLTGGLVDEIFEEALGTADTGSSCPIPPGFQPLDVDIVGAGETATVNFLDPANGNVLAAMPVSGLQQWMASPDPLLLPQPVKQNYFDSGLTLDEYLQLLRTTF